MGVWGTRIETPPHTQKRFIVPFHKTKNKTKSKIWQIVLIFDNSTWFTSKKHVSFSWVVQSIRFMSYWILLLHQSHCHILHIWISNQSPQPTQTFEVVDLSKIFISFLGALMVETHPTKSNPGDLQDLRSSSPPVANEGIVGTKLATKLQDFFASNMCWNQESVRLVPRVGGYSAHKSTHKIGSCNLASVSCTVEPPVNAGNWFFWPWKTTSWMICFCCFPLKKKKSKKKELSKTSTKATCDLKVVRWDVAWFVLVILHRTHCLTDF